MVDSEMSFSRILAIDWETSALLRDSDSERSYSYGPQGIELGAVVIDAQNWMNIGDFSSRIRFDPSMLWEKSAESIHGMTQIELQAAPNMHVVAERFDTFLGQFFMRGQPILLAGQNPSYDRWFTHQLFVKGGYTDFPWRFHSRMIDTFTLGFNRWGCITGNQLYQKVCGVVRNTHSAYEDARLSAQVVCEAFRLNSSSYEVINE